MNKQGRVYFQGLVTCLLWGIMIFWHQEEIQAEWSRPHDSWLQGSVQILRASLGLPTETKEPGSLQPVQIATPSQAQGDPGLPTSEDLQDQVTEWNRTYDQEAVNQWLLEYLPEGIAYDPDLALATDQRAQELGDAYYLGNHRPDGSSLETLYEDLVWEGEALSEVLYEIYLPPANVHWQTWQHPELLAQYIQREVYRDLDLETIRAQAVSATVRPYLDPETQTEFMRLILVLAYI